MNEITLLHLSDIHFKRSKKETDPTFRRDVMEKMTSTIRQHLDKYGVEPGFVAVTGDIAFSGKEKEYHGARPFWEKLKTLLPKAEFLVVPGNHDVDRDRGSTVFSLHNVVHDKEIVDRLLQSQKEINTFIISRIKAYKEFVAFIHPGLYPSKNDYFWVKDYEKKDISFLGLDSSWACEGDDDCNNITLGYPQVRQALEKAKSTNRVVLMHHPPFNWFYDKDFKQYNDEIFKNCGLILHGHTHGDNAFVYRTPAYACICLGVSATYTKDKDGFIGFQFVEVKFQDKGVVVRWRPYQIYRKGEVRFVPDAHRWEGQEGDYFELDTFKEEEKNAKKPGAGKNGKPVKPRGSLRIPGDYIEWVRQFHSKMDIDLLAKKGEAITVSLPEVYIPIETRNPFYKPGQEGQEEGRRGSKKIPIGQRDKHDGPDGVDESLLNLLEPGGRSGEEAEGREAAIDIEKLVGLKKCILLQGGAGSGKTTLVKHLAYTVTAGLCRPQLSGFLPVPVFLKDFWLIYSEVLQKKPVVPVFEELLALYLEKIKCPLDWETISAYLEQQRAVFLIDGLDEVPVQLRTDLLEMVCRFRYAHKENIFLITGRPHGFDGVTGGTVARFGEEVLEILPLDHPRVEEFVKKWFRAISGRASGLGQVTADAMIADLRRPGQEHLSIFTRNPLLLTAVCILYQDGKRFPDQRADLYNRIIDNLVYRRFHNPAQPDREKEVLEFLMTLAYKAQESNRKTIDTGDALTILKQTFPQKPGEAEIHYQRRVLELYNQIEPACGLFNCLSSGEIEFIHLTYQEFLAAKYMIYMDIGWKSFLDKEWWEETLLLYTGLIGAANQKKRSNDIVARILALGKKNKSTRCILLAGRALGDLPTALRKENVVKAVRSRLYDLLQPGVPITERFQAGELVGYLGDTRTGSDKMVTVPAGEFTRGSNKYGDSKPVKKIFLDAYEMGLYPVTNREYRGFIEDRGYDREEFWVPEGWAWRQEEKVTEPLYWYDRQWNGPNFPVVGVSWYEAAAYAAWLSKVSKVTGKPFRLPTEAEWEKAARGTDGRKYPWGNEFDINKCNSAHLEIDHLIPVGIFPDGKSPYGCFDMAGNVWEWCDDWCEGPLEDTMRPAKGSYRVIRGGCWGNFRRGLLCSHSNCNFSVSRDYDLGFRLARSL